MPWSYSINGVEHGGSHDGKVDRYWLDRYQQWLGWGRKRTSPTQVVPPSTPPKAEKVSVDPLREAFGVDIGHVDWKSLAAPLEPPKPVSRPDPPKPETPTRYRPDPEDPALPVVPPRLRRSVESVGTHGFMRVYCIGCEQPIRIPAPERVFVSEVVRERSWCRKCLGVAGRVVIGMVKSDRRAWRVGDYPSERQYHGGTFYNAEW